LPPDFVLDQKLKRYSGVGKKVIFILRTNKTELWRL